LFKVAMVPGLYLCWAILGFAPQGCAEVPLDASDPATADIEPFPIQVTLSDLIPTVATVDWTLRIGEGATATVEFTLGDEWQHTDAVTRQGDLFSCVLVGLKPRTEYRLRATVEADDAWFESEEAILHTGALPTAFPDLQMDIDPGDESEDGYIVTSLIGAFSAAVILDREGSVVWWHQPAESISKIPRATLSSDRKSVLYLWEEDQGVPPSTIVSLTRVAMDGSSVDTLAVDNAHHDFVELPDGTLAVLARDKRTVEGWDKLVFGDRIEEYRPGGGDPVVVWSTFDSWTFEGGSLDTGHYDWTHANALDYDPLSGTYSVSLNGLRVIATIDRQTGELLEQIGGDESDYSAEEAGGRLFGPQHQFQFLDGGLLVFDNGSAEDYESRVIEVGLDSELMLAEPTWIYSASPALFCPCQGDVSRLPGGSTLITWSPLGQIQEVSPAGELLWQVNTELGNAFGYASHVAGLDLPGSG